MKLFTEEQVRRAISIGLSVGYSPSFTIDDTESTINQIYQELTPIVLPSDEEVEATALGRYDGWRTKSINDELQYQSFKSGVKFLTDKIKGGNKL